jgi:hypothetical protein
MLDKLNREVLAYGPAALLPQNLRGEWLQVLQERADAFLDANFELDACRTPAGPADPLLSTCVKKILESRQAPIDDLLSEEFLEKVTIFCLALTMETAARESDLRFDPPDLGNLLFWERIYRFRDRNPEFVGVLQQACILRNPKRSWLTNIREKFRKAARFR